MYANGGGLGAQGAGVYRGGGMAGGGMAGGGGGMAGGSMAGGGIVGIGGGGGVYRGGSNAGMAGGTGFGAGAAGGASSGCCVGGGPGCLVGGASCGDGGDAGCGGGVVTGGALTYVGTGGGDWVTETTYKYVGAGAGDLTAVVQTKRNLSMFLVVPALLVAVVLAVVLWPTGPDTTTTIAPVLPPPHPPFSCSICVHHGAGADSRCSTCAAAAPEIKSCLFWGDPHLVSFDGARPSFYGNGEYWIVKNDKVHIQGRYMGTKYTFGLAATQKVAIGGPFLQGHTIEVEPMEHTYGGHILVDGSPVLNDFGQQRIGNIATIDYNGYGKLIDEAASVWTTRAVHLSLPEGVHMTIFRWGNYLDMKITMKKPDSTTDGSCGNFNNDPSDDTPAAVFDRIGARVPRSELMFSTDAVVAVTTEEEDMLQTQCPRATLSNAQAKCRRQLDSGAADGQVQACAFDVCFGMNEHALRSAKNYATQAEKRAAHE